MKIKTRVYFRCYDCPKHTGANGTFDTLNDAMEHMRDYRHHIIHVLTEVEVEAEKGEHTNE